MKTRMILAAMLLLAFGTARAQNQTANTIVVQTTGDVILSQGQNFSVFWDVNDRGGYDLKDNTVTLSGTADFRVELPELKSLMVVSTGDVTSNGTMTGDNVRIEVVGTGDVSLDLDYANVYTRIAGTGDVHLKGRCSALFAEVFGTGDVDAKSLDIVLGLANVYSKGEVRLGKNVQYIAYHTEGPAKGKGVTDESLCSSCSQGSRVGFERTEGGEWKLNECVSYNINVREALQTAGPYFAEQTGVTWLIPEDGQPMTPYDSASLSELMRELGVTLQQLSDSVDWEQFERDMEQWGAEMEKWGRKMEKWGRRMEDRYGRANEHHYEYHSDRPAPKENKPKDKRPVKRSLLFDAHWNGFEAGLNMLLDPSAMNTYTGPDDFMAIRPMRSWYFGFNIADVGIAFDRKHTVGLFTGIGIGWNNYSWKNYIRMTVENNELVNTLLPDDRPVKNSKFGLLYAQVPLMIEVRPTPRFYIDLGVTGGIRLASWTRIKYADGENQKTYNNYLTNLFKCDASLRIGGENLGFFANYALVPTFVKGRDAAKAHPFMLGFSINF